MQWLQLSWFCYAAFQWWVGRAQSLGTNLGEMSGIVIWGVEKGAQLWLYLLDSLYLDAPIT